MIKSGKMSRVTNNRKVVEVPGVYRSWMEIMTWIEKNEEFGPVGVIEGLEEIEELLNELSFYRMEYDNDTDIYERKVKDDIYRVYLIKSSSFIAGELFRKGLLEKIKEMMTRKKPTK